MYACDVPTALSGFFSSEPCPTVRGSLMSRDDKVWCPRLFEDLNNCTDGEVIPYHGIGFQYNFISTFRSTELAVKPKTHSVAYI